MKAAITIRLCLAKNILANVFGISIAKGLWEKHEHMYEAKSLSNRLYLKEQFHTLGMEEGTRISDHMITLNGIILDLEVIGVVISDKDKALRLFWYLPTSYEHMKPILMYGKDTMIYSEVTTKLLSEERRLGVENQAHVASCLCMFLSIFRILFSFFNFLELMQCTVIITVIIIIDLESF